MIYTTLNKIRENEPCSDGWRKLLAGLNKTGPDDELLPLVRILEINGLHDALWALRTTDCDRESRLLAVAYARQVQHLMADERSIACIDVAKRFANGKATREELEEARAAGSAAWAAAGAAAGAAGAAAWAAAEAAWAAAGFAARAAAWAAAGAAAGAAGAAAGAAGAAGSAAWAAADAADAAEAARNAAWAAAGAAAEAAATRAAATPAAADAAGEAAWAAGAAAGSAARDNMLQKQIELFNEIFG